MKREATFYFVMLGLAAAGIAAVLHWGTQLPGPPLSAGVIPAKIAEATGDRSMWASMADLLGRNFHHPLSQLFVQLLVVIAAAQGMGRLFRAFGQPSVVGEMAAGILLGPSLMGMVAPEAFSFIFPAESLGSLKLLSQVGVCLFMFTVGMELDAGHLRHKARTAVIVSHASIVVPYLLGVLLAYFLFTSLAQPGTTFTAFSLFMGISMSITAFPVLARILQERQLSRTYLGSTAIACAAVDDVTAWSLLAFVVAIVRAGSLAACALNLAFIALFVSVMMWVIRPGLRRWIGRDRLEADETSKGVLAVVMCIVVASALCTEVIGIHALFGAFLAGAIMPETGSFRHKLAVRVENFSTVLLLPLFFAFTGLRTQIGLLNDVQGWLICLAIIAVATIGKLGGTAITARVTGMSWRDSLQLGALMNTRGLMELIALNLGYDLGILSPRIFTMLVLMALVTTALTGPLLSKFQRMRG